MKKVVPHSGKVAKEARECVQECVSEFISFITRLMKTIQCTIQNLTTSVRLFYLILDFDLTLTYSEASERCQAEKRKTINGEEETRLFAELMHSFQAKTFCLRCQPLALTTMWNLWSCTCRSIEKQWRFTRITSKSVNWNMATFDCFPGWETDGGRALQPGRGGYGWTATSGLFLRLLDSWTLFLLKTWSSCGRRECF